MKKIIGSVIFVFLGFSSNLMATSPKEHAQYHISVIDMILDSYAFEGDEYKINFDYCVGHLNGQRKAYQDMSDILSHE